MNKKTTRRGWLRTGGAASAAALMSGAGATPVSEIHEEPPKGRLHPVRRGAVHQLHGHGDEQRWFANAAPEVIEANAQCRALPREHG